MQAKAVGTLGKNVLTRSGWSKAEEELLVVKLSEAARDGTPLGVVFCSVAADTGRQPNSVRNYYYTAVRSRLAGTEESTLVRREHRDFTTFSDDEIKQLLITMLTKLASGKSVRACAMELGSGNCSRMLRYQNKYRSLIKNRRALVDDIMRSLDRENIPYFNPYGEEEKPPMAKPERGSGHALAHEMLAAFNEGAGINLVELAKNMNEIVTRMSHEKEADLKKRELTAEESADNFMKKLRQLTESVRGYLITKDPSQLSELLQEMKVLKQSKILHEN